MSEANQAINTMMATAVAIRQLPQVYKSPLKTKKDRERMFTELAETTATIAEEAAKALLIASRAQRELELVRGGGEERAEVLV